MAGEDKAQKPSQSYWLIYVALLLGGLLLIADASHYAPFQKISAKLGIGMLYSAFALFIGNGKPAGMFATAIIWIAILATFLVQ